MSKPISKTTRRVLIVLAILLLLGACFTAVSIYAKKEMNKERYPKPDGTLLSARELPEGKEDVIAYAVELYNKAITADDVETNWHTDVKVKDYAEEKTLPLSEADQQIFYYIWENAGDALKAFYPQADRVTESKNEGVFDLNITPDDVTDFSASRGRYNDDGVYIDDDWYFINLTVNPDTVDASAIPDGEIFKQMKAAFADACDVENAAVEVTGVRMAFRIARAFDQLASLEITRSYRVNADVTLKGDYAPLAENGKAHVSLPYEATEKIGFTYYGAHFTEKAIAVNPGDMSALPASVTVKKEATQEEFTLEFTPSAEDVVKIDADGVMTVLKAYDEPLNIHMKLTFNGRVYEDDLTVYITELEVETNAG